MTSFFQRWQVNARILVEESIRLEKKTYIACRQNGGSLPGEEYGCDQMYTRTLTSSLTVVFAVHRSRSSRQQCHKSCQCSRRRKEETRGIAPQTLVGSDPGEGIGSDLSLRRRCRTTHSAEMLPLRASSFGRYCAPPCAPNSGVAGLVDRAGRCGSTSSRWNEEPVRKTDSFSKITLYNCARLPFRSSGGTVVGSGR
jgi:hypothetical protein